MSVFEEPVKKIKRKKKSKHLSKRKYSKDDLYWLARVVSAEAKGEPREGQIAVANVVLNRATKYKKTITEVIFKKSQFTSVTNNSIRNEPTKLAIESANEALNGAVQVDKNVLFFYNPNKVSEDSTIRHYKIIKTIGNHVFCTDEKIK